MSMIKRHIESVMHRLAVEFADNFDPKGPTKTRVCFYEERIWDMWSSHPQVILKLNKIFIRKCGFSVLSEEDIHALS